MIGLASPGGALNLEQEAVADATPAGTGSVNGTNVAYYDVTIDMTQLADTADLTDVQRADHPSRAAAARAGWLQRHDRADRSGRRRLHP